MSVAYTQHLIETYYEVFNSGDREAFLSLLTEDVIHDVNQGPKERGRELFRVFLERMDHCYREKIRDLEVMVNHDGSRAAVEFIVHGIYLNTDDGLPPASGQTYTLPAGAFFTIVDDKVARISNYYNLPEWTRQISDPFYLTAE